MIKVGIVGYGNLGRGVHYAIDKFNDMELVGIFTRRNPSNVKPILNAKVYEFNKLKDFKGIIDVLLICGGSATDLPVLTPELLKDFCVVDSFDTHAKIPEHFKTCDAVAKSSKTVGVISAGWDPGIFSMVRCLFSSVLPEGNDYTFWGKGVSQGHSDAIRRIQGVKNAIQYTIPKEEALDKVRSGKNPMLTARDKHLRECFVAVEDGADKNRIEQEIKTMPNYFDGYDTVIHFVSEEEVKKLQEKLSHGGFVIRSGNTTDKNSHILELSLKLDSNPEFTGSVLTCYARAVYRLYKENKSGVFTVLDIPLGYLSTFSNEELRKNLL